MSNFKVMRKMITLVAPLSGVMTIAVFMGVVGYLCAIFIPVGTVTLAAYTLTNSINLTVPFLLLIVLAVLRGILHYLEQACNHYIAFKLLALIRDKVFKALRMLAPAKLEGRDKGELIALITNDIELLEVFYAHTISPILIAVLCGFVLLGFFYMIHPVFALIALIAYLLVSIAIPLFVTKMGKEDGNEVRKKIGELSSYLLASLRGMLEVLQYGSGANRIKGIQSQSEEVNQLQKKLKNIEGLSQALGNLVVLTAAVCVLYVGLTMVMNGSLELTQAVFVFILMFSSFGPFLALSSLSNNLLLTLASGRRVLSLLEETPQVNDITAQSSTAFGIINVEQVSFAYDQETILDDISLQFGENQIIGIHGKSGSGKSTLLKLIMRFWEIQKGSIRINDCAINTINTSDLRAMESYATQETVLFHDSIENNLRIAKLDATHEEIVAACQKASIHEFIESLPQGYQTTVAELGSSLSGGERQRIGIARTFLHDSDCILLDEPTSNLDALNEAIILKSLSACKDKTILLVSHRKSTLKAASRIIEMESGRVS